MEAAIKTKHITKKAVALIKQLHGTSIGATEFSSGFSGERCDALLFNSMSSFLIETKVSRADFLADKKKSFRAKPEDGVGEYRYYACPIGLISIEELPEKWGLIYVDCEKTQARATMPIGYGGRLPVTKKEGMWIETVGHNYYGSLSIADKEWNDAEQPQLKYKFKPCEAKERRSLFFLATRYKTNKFMDNIL